MRLHMPVRILIVGLSKNDCGCQMKTKLYTTRTHSQMRDDLMYFLSSIKLAVPFDTLPCFAQSSYVLVFYQRFQRTLAASETTTNSSITSDLP